MIAASPTVESDKPAYCELSHMVGRQVWKLPDFLFTTANSTCEDRAPMDSAVVAVHGVGPTLWTSRHDVNTVRTDRASDLSHKRRVRAGWRFPTGLKSDMARITPLRGQIYEMVS